MPFTQTTANWTLLANTIILDISNTLATNLHMAEPTATELISKLTGKSVEVAPRMRQAFMSGLVEYCNRKNKSLHDVVADWWEEDWRSAGNLLTKFMPREVKVDAKYEHDHRHRTLAVSRLDDFLIGVTEQGGKDAANEGTGSKGSVLPSKIPAKQT